MATELARAVLCETEGRTGAGACGRCPSCLTVEGKRHPDVVFFLPEKGKVAYPVKQVREEIRRHAYLKPAIGRNRFLIIERAEALTRGSGGQNESADTLLKLLEEPPAATIIILLAAHPERLPETIRSRCHQVRFDPPAAVDLAAELAAEHAMAPDEALFAANLAGGDLTVARGFFVARKKDKLDLKRVRETLLTIVRSLRRLPYPDLFSLAAALDTSARGWPALTGALGSLAALYRDAAMKALRQGVDAAALTFPAGPEAAATDEAGMSYDAERLRAASLRALRAQEDSRRYPARLLLLEVLLIDLEALFSPESQGVSS